MRRRYRQAVFRPDWTRGTALPGSESCFPVEPMQDGLGVTQAQWTRRWRRRWSRRAIIDESLRTFYPKAGGDVASDDRHLAGGPCRLSLPAALGAAGSGLSHHPGLELL